MQRHNAASGAPVLVRHFWPLSSILASIQARRTRHVSRRRHSRLDMRCRRAVSSATPHGSSHPRAPGRATSPSRRTPKPRCHIPKPTLPLAPPTQRRRRLSGPQLSRAVGRLRTPRRQSAHAHPRVWARV